MLINNLEVSSWLLVNTSHKYYIFPLSDSRKIRRHYHTRSLTEMYCNITYHHMDGVWIIEDQMCLNHLNYCIYIWFCNILKLRCNIWNMIQAFRSMILHDVDVGLMMRVCYLKRTSGPYSNIIPDLKNGAY